MRAILYFNTIMAIDLADITVLTKQCLAILNASSSYAATSDDDKFTDDEVEEALLEGDERFWLVIAETVGHWARPDIMTESADITTNGAEVESHTGELGLVTIKYVDGDSDYKLGKPMKREEIEIILRDTDSTYNAVHNVTGTLSAGYFDPEALKDGIAYFTGIAFRVRIAAYARSAACQSPQSYAAGTLAHAWGVLFSKDGLDPELARYYSGEADKREGQARGNAKVLTDLPEMRKAA